MKAAKPTIRAQSAFILPKTRITLHKRDVKITNFRNLIHNSTIIHQFTLTKSRQSIQHDTIRKKQHKLSSCYFHTTNVIFAPKNYYEILGVPKNADEKTIKEAFVKKAKELHPDINKGSNKDTQKLFVEVSEAYQTLKDPQKRRMYDMQMNSGGWGRASQQSRGSGPEYPWSRGYQQQQWNYENQEEFMRQYSRRYEDVMKDFHDMFQNMRGGSFREYRGPNGARIYEYTVRGPNGQTSTQRREVHGDNPFEFMFKNMNQQTRRQTRMEIPPTFQVFESTNASFRPVLVLVDNGQGIGDITQPKPGYVEWQLDGRVIAKANVEDMEDGKTRIQVMNPAGALMGTVVRTPPIPFLKPFFESITVLDRQQRIVASGFSLNFLLEFSTMYNGAGQPIASISKSIFGLSQGLWNCKYFPRGTIEPEVFLLGGLAVKLYSMPQQK